MVVLKAWVAFIVFILTIPLTLLLILIMLPVAIFAPYHVPDLFNLHVKLEEWVRAKATPGPYKQVGAKIVKEHIRTFQVFGATRSSLMHGHGSLVDDAELLTHLLNTNETLVKIVRMFYEELKSHGEHLLQHCPYCRVLALADKLAGEVK